MSAGKIITFAIVLMLGYIVGKKFPALIPLPI